MLLALGMFAIGADGFVIAGILPDLATGLQVPLSQAGLLVSAFAFTYAISAPILGAVLGGKSLRTILVASMGVFAAANLAAALSEHYAWLLLWRLVAAMSAAAYSPAAVAAAINLLPPEKRGQASSFVLGGLTVALVTAVPLGAMLASASSWRMTFVLIAALAATATATLWWVMPASFQSRNLSLKERLSPLRNSDVIWALVSCFVWMAGGIATYTFIVPISLSATGWSPDKAGFVLLIYGAAAIAGNLIGGRLSDFLKTPVRALQYFLCTHLASLLLMGLAVFSGPPWGAWLFPVAVAVFAASGWACTPPQASRLVSLSPPHAVQVIALNTMATYLGMAVGAAAGGLLSTNGPLLFIPLAGAAAQCIALWMVAARGEQRS
ncbi:MAG: MFS transporter [Roseateles sp.]|uniref:MFS transporter n=1 Tax=Roseateles sp. TaxID=1971397 RepID=UPI0040373111